MSVHRLAAVAVSTLLFFPNATRAQQPQGPLVRGVVVDSDNNPIKGAEVSAIDSAHAVIATTR